MWWYVTSSYHEGGWSGWTITASNRFEVRDSYISTFSQKSGIPLSSGNFTETDITNTVTENGNLGWQYTINSEMISSDGRIKIAAGSYFQIFKDADGTGKFSTKGAGITVYRLSCSRGDNP